MRSIALLLLFATPTFAQPLVAPTDARTPEEERKSFKLPPGFTAQLVASEPDIQKPMQLAFDAKGRIWVTTSYHYPFAAEKGQATDKLFILSDFDANGKAKKVETFDDKLNIPIGILPLPDCKSCIVSSVGEILKLTDTDGDGKADRREVLFTGFGSRDTHGMYNSYTYMPDGWVYACHGFANDSHVRGKDGHEVHLNSGNTFRFRPDGSRIEVYTRGQVNPFGMTVDPWFNLYTADCHSKPITQLIKGAYYDSFGKPHDGLGYAPHVTRHDHGSTGLCGLAWYDADHFPKEWNGVMFLGNVVTSRINIDRIEWKGSTPVAKELPDFLVSSDPWFRPVDIKLGPDGALYVNDFYNKIIGHYEVDLKHPQRDKGRGRMWRIVYEGRPFSREAKPGAAKPATVADRPTALRNLADPSPRVVRNAVGYLADDPHTDSILPLAKLIPTIPAEDVGLRHATRIALRNALAAVPSHEQLSWLLKPYAESRESTAAAIDDVFLGVPSKSSAWWYSWRFELQTLAPAFSGRAAEHVGRYGGDEERLECWKSIYTRGDVGAQLKFLVALNRGLATAGAKYRPAHPEQNGRRFYEGLILRMNSGNTALVQETLEYAIALKIDLAYSPWYVATDTKNPEPIRQLALTAMEHGSSEVQKRTFTHLLRDPSTPEGLRDRAITTGFFSTKLLDQIALKDLLHTASYRQCVTIANGLAGSKSGADLLFAEVKAGKASARLLQEKTVLERLKATNAANWEATVKELTAGIPSADARLAALIKERGDGYRKSKHDIEAGKKVFTTTCANCHQVGGQGAKIGPQLDGIGNRGVERLLEDTLDPNRNVDHAFHTTILDLKDGGQLTGLLRVEGQVLIVVDSQAKEKRVSIDDVDKKRTSPVSPMPSDIAEKLKPKDFYDLIAYLADLKAK